MASNTLSTTQRTLEQMDNARTLLQILVEDQGVYFTSVSVDQDHLKITLLDPMSLARAVVALALNNVVFHLGVPPDTRLITAQGTWARLDIAVDEVAMSEVAKCPVVLTAPRHL